jgi:hypothetical protein
MPVDQFVIRVSLANAAFEDHRLDEVARILEEQAQKLRRFGDQSDWSDRLKDINGNVVGYARIE